MKRTIYVGTWLGTGDDEAVDAYLTIDDDKLGRFVHRARESGAKRQRRANVKKPPTMRATMAGGAFVMELRKAGSRG